MASCDDHHLVHHQSTATAGILSSEIDSSHPISNSIDTHLNGSRGIPSGEIDLSGDHNITRSDSRTALDLPSFVRNSEEHPSRLPLDNSTTADLSYNPHLPHSSTLSPPQHFQAHQTTPGCIPSCNSDDRLPPSNETSDTRHTITSTQSSRLLGNEPRHPLDPLSAGQAQLVPACDPNPPAKKNRKPLAQCPYCGMTFKKLEHCQRHERTHTLARPYSCAVCSKTFARQDTLNRHLRLHSRSEGRVAASKSVSQVQESQPQALSPSSLKAPSRKPLSSSAKSSTDLFALSGLSPSTHISSLPFRRQAARERGLSLSALEHSSFPAQIARDVSLAGSGPRQSISLPLQRSYQHQPSPLFQSSGNHPHPLPGTSHISSQALTCPTMCIDGGAGLPIEVRRGSWCPGVPSLNEFAIFPTSESTPHLIRNHTPHALQRSFVVNNWETNLTTTFGLVEAGIGPIPLSAPATCTKWSGLGIESSGTGNSYATAPSSVVPTWETLSQFEIQPQSRMNWPALRCLEEEDQAKPEPEQGNFNTCQIILSSPSQSDSFDQPNSVDPNCITGSSSTMIGVTEADTSASFWCFPSGSSLPTPNSSQVQTSQPLSAAHNDMVDCFANHWSASQKDHVEMLNPVIWHLPACYNGEDLEANISSDPTFPA